MRPRVLLVTDLGYRARGRRYGDEDVALAADLRRHLDLAMCHPLDAAALLGAFEVVVVRNSGPVIHHREAYEHFRRTALAAEVPVFTQLSGKGDQRGKQYLLDLHRAGFPVIPTVDAREDLSLLPPASSYVVKPVLGADSVGLRVVTAAELDGIELVDELVQPRVDFVHEVSFYFVDRTFHYALHAPDPAARWELEPVEPTAQDLAFAQRFVDWNDVDHGIQRVDACRTRDGGLLLVELEDLNPYLSLDAVAPEVRDRFVTAVVDSVTRLAQRRHGSPVHDVPMTTRHGTMATDRPERYAKQLAGHWSQKATVTADETSTTLVMSTGQTLVMRPAAGALALEVSVPPDGDLDQWAEVVARHLERFGQREELHVVWG